MRALAEAQMVTYQSFGEKKETDYWLRVSDVARADERDRSGEGSGLPRRGGDFGPEALNLSFRSRTGLRRTPSQFGTECLVYTSRSGVS
jgi:hypothetical protein